MFAFRSRWSLQRRAWLSPRRWPARSLRPAVPLSPVVSWPLPGFGCTRSHITLTTHLGGGWMKTVSAVLRSHGEVPWPVREVRRAPSGLSPGPRRQARWGGRDTLDFDGTSSRGNQASV
jgi:hypothetical protein